MRRPAGIYGYKPARFQLGDQLRDLFGLVRLIPAVVVILQPAQHSDRVLFFQVHLKTALTEVGPKLCCLATGRILPSEAPSWQQTQAFTCEYYSSQFSNINGS